MLFRYCIFGNPAVPSLFSVCEEILLKTITVKLPETLAIWLSNRSIEMCRPQSEIVREVLQQASDGTGSKSCHDAFADLCVSIKKPDDLSTNSSHLNGFGE